MASETNSNRSAGNPILVPHESMETHDGPGRPDSEAEASDRLSTTSSKPASNLLRCQDYKPTTLRWWYHGALVICLATFLGLTEYAIQTLLASQQKDLASRLWSSSIGNHYGDQQSASSYEEPPYERLARIPSNAISSQAGVYSLNNTGDSLALSYSSSALAATMDSAPPGPTSSHDLPSTELLLSYSESRDKSSLVLTSTSIADGPYPSTTDALDTTSRNVESSGPSKISPSLTTSTSGTPILRSDGYLTLGTITTIDSTSYATTADGYLNLGTTTSTMRNPTPHVEISNPDGGYVITVPSSPTPGPEVGDTPASDIPRLTFISESLVGGDKTTDLSMSFTSAYLHLGPTSLTTYVDNTPGTPSVGGHLSLGTTTAPIAIDIDPPPPATTPKITTLPGGTSAYQSASTLPPAVHGESVTVIRQIEVWPSSKRTFERTTTDSRGHVTVQTITADGPAKTSVLETTVTMRPGEAVVAVPKLVTKTRGGQTQAMQTTFVDSEGRTTTSLYTTVVGVESVLATHTYFLATSLPPGYTVLTIPTAVPTTERGMVEVVQTVYTDAEGHVTTSTYTKTLNGIPTTRTVPLVIATPVTPGHRHVTISAVIPTTIGGKTKVIESTSTDGRGQPTPFSYTTVEGGTATSTTVWTIVPTPTSANSSRSNGAQDTESANVVVYGIGLRGYLLGAFLPTVLAAIIAYPFKLININARLMQPFHELATVREPDGVSAEASIFLRFYDWTGALSLPRSVRLRQPVIVISDLLVLGAALLAPIAAETVSVQVPDGCDLGCHGSLGVTTIPGRVLEALMATMMALLIALIVLLNVFGWETGVSHNPWGIAGMASLGLSPGIRDSIRRIPCNSKGYTKERMILEALAETKYALEECWMSSSRGGSVGIRGYGIVVKTSNSDAKKPVSMKRRGNTGSWAQKSEKKRRNQPFALLTWWGRCILLFTFVCVLIIATYYETTSLDSGFERFMNSRGFGIRFFFTALGVIIGGCMETFFRSVATVLPYQLLSNHALPAGRSILLSPPTNAFYGLFSAFKQRSIFLGAVSFATILAELLLPVTLSHVPFSHLNTYETQLVCAWLSIGILAFMILVILCSFFIRWPHMPVDPRTIAGAMFYVCDSWMLDAMEGMATLGKKERDLSIHSQRLKYQFASSEGISGKERMNVDFCDMAGETAVMKRNQLMRRRGVAT